MATAIDLTNQRFGAVVAMRREAPGSSWWVIRCDCGIETTAPGRDLRAGKRRTCGWRPRGSHLPAP